MRAATSPLPAPAARPTDAPSGCAPARPLPASPRNPCLQLQEPPCGVVVTDTGRLRVADASSSPAVRADGGRRHVVRQLPAGPLRRGARRLSVPSRRAAPGAVPGSSARRRRGSITSGPVPVERLCGCLAAAGAAGPGWGLRHCARGGGPKTGETEREPWPYPEWQTGRKQKGKNQVEGMKSLTEEFLWQSSCVGNKCGHENGDPTKRGRRL